MVDKQRIIKTLQDMLKIPSISGNENTLAEYIEEDMKSAGFKVNRDKIGNVYAELGKGKRTIMLNGHMDTVPPEGYEKDPYSGRVKEGKIYGLGASDMKAGLAVMMETMKSISSPEDGKLVLSFVVSEEATLSKGKYEKGCMYAAEKYPNVDTCIVLEPTMSDAGEPSISIGCRGRTILKARIHGKSTHSSRPETGMNPIDFVYELIKDLKKQRLEKQKFFDDWVHETMSIVQIDSGSSATNIIPSYADITVDYRTMPGRRDAVKTLSRILDEQDVEIDFGFLFSSPGYVLREGNKFVKLAKSCVKDVFGSEPAVGVARGRADAEYFHRNGTATIIFGPGINRQAHKPDEYAIVKPVVKSADAVVDITEKWLG